MKHSGILYITKMSFIFDLPEKMAKNVKKNTVLSLLVKKKREKKTHGYIL